MQLSKSNKLLLLWLLAVLLCFRGRAQEVLNNVQLEKLATEAFRVRYQLNGPTGFAFNTVNLKIFRKRDKEIKEVFSGPITPRDLSPRRGQTYVYDWKPAVATVRPGDELQARVTISYLKPVIAKTTVKPGNNLAPTANAGQFIEVQLPVTAPVRLNGSRSVDRDGRIVAAKWKQIGGWDTLVIRGADSLIAYVSGDLREGRYAFELTVTDDGGRSSSDRIILTVKPGPPVPTVPSPKPDVVTKKKDSVSARKDSVPLRAVTVSRSFTKLKGGPANALVNVLLPGLGHYIVSGDHKGNNRKKSNFIITAVYAGSVGGAIYYRLKSDEEHNKYKEFSDYREYQRDVNGNVIGVRGANQAQASQHLDKAKTFNRNSIILMGVSAGIFTADLVWTLVKGLKNKSRWAKENRSRTGLMISTNGTDITAGIRIKL